MCCCGTPTINGQPGYKWQPNDAPAIRQPHPPELSDGDVLLFDEPGRCGRGIDSHSHDFRLILDNVGRVYLLVRHGGGTERIRVGWRETVGSAFLAMSSDDRYWVFQAIHGSASDAEDAARNKANATWQRAAAEKRIKTRKAPGRESYKVWIEPAKVEQSA